MSIRLDDSLKAQIRELIPEHEDLQRAVNDNCPTLVEALLGLLARPLPPMKIIELLDAGESGEIRRYCYRQDAAMTLLGRP